MAQQWFFRADGQRIVLRGRIEMDGVFGDTEEHITPDADLSGTPGLTYAALKAAGAGVLEISDDGQSFTITPAGKA